MERDTGTDLEELDDVASTGDEEGEDEGGEQQPEVEALHVLGVAERPRGVAVRDGRQPGRGTSAVLWTVQCHTVSYSVIWWDLIGWMPYLTVMGTMIPKARSSSGGWEGKG